MALQELLARAQSFGPYYPANGLMLSNHLPMALVALERLGGEEARLRHFYDAYVGRLRPAAPPGAASAPDRWRAHLGNASAYAALREAFADLIAARGRGATLRTALPVLVPGIGAAAFHGAIRTAYAIEAANDAELGSALAAWAVSWFRLDAPPPAGDRDIAAVLESVRGDAALAYEPRTGTTIASDMLEAAALAGFGEAVARVAPDALTLPALAESALAIYLAEYDFTALHLVTGLHAARRLAGCCDSNLIARSLWPLVLAAYVSIGRPVARFDRVHAGDAEIDWATLRQSASACDDEHDIKIAYSAWQEWCVYGWPGCALATRRAIAR